MLPNNLTACLRPAFQRISLYPLSPKDTAAKAFEDTLKSKQGILKSIAQFFKFRANAQKREKERVLNIIKSLSIGDSIRITADNLKLMIATIADKQDQHYDTIMALIDSLQSRFPLVTTLKDITHPTTDSTGVTDSTVTDLDISEIIKKLLPPSPGKPLTKKEKEERAQKTTTTRNIIDMGPQSFRKREGISIKDYSLTLRKLTSFYGFYNTAEPYDSRNTPFKEFDWWIYDALQFNGKTGNFTALNNWNTIPNIADTAKNAGCKIAFTIQLANPTTTSSFLKSVKAQHKLSDGILELLSKRPADGINIHFATLDESDRNRFTDFVSFLSKAVKQAHPGFQVALTLPEEITPTYINISDLDSSCDAFFINDSSAVSYFLSQKVPASKFIFTVPANAYEASDLPAITGRFEMVTDNKLGGAGICYVGNNVNYIDVWNSMLYTLTTIDTTLVKDSTITSTHPFTFWEKLYRRLALYNYIITNPCEECFEHIQGDSSINYLLQYVHDLGLDTVVRGYNKQQLQRRDRPADLRRVLVTEFEYLSNELTRFLLCASLIMLLGCIIFGVVYVYNLKNKGDDWSYKKPVARILMAFTILLTLFAFSYVFVNDQLPFFGVGNTVKIHWETIGIKSGSYFKKSLKCMPDPDCVNISLYTLLGIITLGGIVGILTARFLILPLLKQNDVP
ncbi:hypothetical protein [Filimonas lacunae]|uniref:hypothetical protein n=1 Tax=Filimonas lacunae TaxID=477680 RepID=UPI000BBA444D|nr:hypothetical protein [Filimonas lacunae]